VGGGNDIVFSIYRNNASSLGFVRFDIGKFCVLGPVTSMTGSAASERTTVHFLG
jgi:hypothetical protein